MLTFAMLITDRCMGSGIFSVLDVITAANYVHEQRTGEKLLEMKLIGTKEYAYAYNGQRIGPLLPVEHIEQPDVLILPGMVEAVMGAKKMRHHLNKYTNLHPTLIQWHKQGTLMAASCSGNLLFADTGIAKGRPITCHWASEQAVKTLFPEQTFHIQEMLIDHGDIISMGGATAIGQLILNLIERFAGRELANRCAKIMLIEPERALQGAYSLFNPNKRHGDELVLAVQEWLEQTYAENPAAATAAEKWNMSERQLSRRFKQATSETINSYLQKLRLEHVKRGLELSKKLANTLIWESGYEDVSSFRRLFKRETGMTMKAYRQRFGVSQTPVLDGASCEV